MVLNSGIKINLIAFIHSIKPNRRIILKISLVFLLFGFVLVISRLINRADPIAQPSKSFTQISETSGISKTVQQAGVSWTDYDGDGFPDLLLVTTDRYRYSLFHNNHDGTFTETTKTAGLSNLPTFNGGAAVFGDYDNDGCPDLYIAITGIQNVDQRPKLPQDFDRLFHNNCDGTFTDVTPHSNIRHDLHSVGASWVDYNNDGLLDIYVSTWGAGRFDLDHNITFEPDILYRNNGDGTFTNVTKQAGLDGLVKCKVIKSYSPFPKDKNWLITNVPPTIWKPHWQPIWFDFNNDGAMDFYVGNDAGVGQLFRNDGQGNFTDVTDQAGLCQEGSGMGVSVGDYDNDGYMDLYVTHSQRNMLWHNNHDGTFTEVSEESGVANFGSLGWGTEFLDYDNDGNLDLYAVSGATGLTRVMKYISNTSDKLYKGDGKGSFKDVSKNEGIFGNDPKTGAAIADINNDGFMDIFVTSDRTDPKRGGRSAARLYLNRSNGNHWIKIELVGTKSNRNAIGARIAVTANGKTQMRQIVAGSSFLSQSTLWPIFGLGKVDRIDKIEINWPSGQFQRLTNITADQKMTITEIK